MSGKKKIKLTEENRKDDNLSENSRLLTLPDELLNLIFNFLSPVDVLSLEQLGFQRIKSLSTRVTQANFHLCSKLTEEDIKAFCINPRVNNIQKLNFNYLSCVKPVKIENIIEKFKHLKALSIKDCGITFSQLNNIFSNCSLNELEELHWDAIYDENDLKQKELINTFPDRGLKNIKRAYFDIYDLRIDITKIISKCINLQSLTLNIRIDLLYYKQAWTTENFVGILSLNFIEEIPNLSSLIVNVDNVNLPSLVFHLISFNLLINKVMLSTFNTLWIDAKLLCKFPCYLDWHKVDFSSVQKSACSGETTFFTSFQIRDEREAIYVLSQLPDSHVSALGIIILETFPDELVTCIQRACRKKLEHFALHAFDKMDNDIVNIPVCLMKVFSICTNITVLELNNIHFSSQVHTSPFFAISMLKYLRRLSLSACIFIPYRLIEKVVPKEKTFNYMIKKCNLVEEFYLNKCCFCCNGPLDPDMNHLCNLKNLKNLSLENIRTFRTLSFLKKIADDCLNFQTLEICTIGYPGACHFQPALCYLLKKSSNLKFLRINHRAFKLDYQLFWDTIGHAQNLQGLCLSSMCCDSFPEKKLINALRKLKNLGLFHLSTKHIPSTLSTNIKKIMAQNGIAMPKLLLVPYRDDDLQEDSINNFLQCVERHFGTQFPNCYP